MPPETEAVLCARTCDHCLNHPCLSISTGVVQQHKNSIYFYRGGEENPKRLSNLWGESQRPINQPVMKVSFPTGGRQKANCAGPRAHTTTALHPLPAPAGIFMSVEEETAFAREEEKRFTPSSICSVSSVVYTLLFNY